MKLCLSALKHAEADGRADHKAGGDTVACLGFWGNLAVMGVNVG